MQLAGDPGPLRGHRLLSLALERRVPRGQGRCLAAAPDEYPDQPEQEDLPGQVPGPAPHLPAEQGARVHHPQRTLVGGRGEDRQAGHHDGQSRDRAAQGVVRGQRIAARAQHEHQLGATGRQVRGQGLQRYSHPHDDPHQQRRTAPQEQRPSDQQRQDGQQPGRPRQGRPGQAGRGPCGHGRQPEADDGETGIQDRIQDRSLHPHVANVTPGPHSAHRPYGRLDSSFRPRSSLQRPQTGGRSGAYVRILSANDGRDIMTTALQTSRLSKRYGHRLALADCTLSIPARHIVGLVGPNGAGKTTLLHLAVGMLAPTSGTIEVLGGRPASGPAQLAKVGFVAQDAPVYAGFTVADHLRFGAHMNPGWDAALARDRIDQLGLDRRQRAGKLSGGQRAQLALTLALAKRPELLILDEPIASLDPLARSEFLRSLAEYTASRQVSVVMSSHLVSDLERICDYLIVLVASRVQVAGPVTDLLASHGRGLEDLVLDYMSRATRSSTPPAPQPTPEA